MSSSDGLIYGFVLDGEGGGKQVGWDQVGEWTPADGSLWLHLDYKDAHALDWLNSSSTLDEVTIQSLISEETRPRAVSYGERLLVILRGVNCNPGADPEDMVALRMLFERHRIITMRHRKVMAVQDVVEEIQAGHGPRDSGDFLAMVCDRIADRMGDVIGELDDAADELEDAVLEAQSYELRPRLATLRRQAIAMRRFIAPQRDVLARLQNEQSPILDEMHRLRLREDAERTARFVEDMDAARDRAAVTQEELNNRLSEQMSRTMYVLSIVAAIFLPLGLLTGLLGINVGGIPGTESRWAFTVVSLLLVLLALLLLGVFKRMKWF
ncbi:zinc transporter ZntB [Thermodesulfobacteriota bacterium]